VGLLLLLVGACTTPNTYHQRGFAILKVNRTLVDSYGYETDVVGDLKQEAVYQYKLRRAPEQQHGARFQVKWKAPQDTAQIRLQLDVRGLNSKNETVFDAVSLSFERVEDWAEWSTLEISNARLKRLGTITAWKATLFASGKMMAELPSSNWYADIKAKEQPLK
jgi:hypothetical protein